MQKFIVAIKYVLTENYQSGFKISVSFIDDSHYKMNTIKSPAILCDYLRKTCKIQWDLCHMSSALATKRLPC